jgi:hypothetical protein
MMAGNVTTIKVQASGAGFLNAWMDFNINGSWADAGDQIFTNTPLIAGWNTLTVNIPAAASSGKTFMRFRFDSQGNLSFTGLALDGEVEDYQVNVCPNWKPTQTNSTHLIAIPASMTMLKPGDVIGVFYTDNQGLVKCGGLVEWTGESQVLVAYGDDNTTPDVKEGFAAGETFVWKIYKESTGSLKDVMVKYNPALPNSDGTFVDFGFSALTTIFGNQNLNIPVGWSGISSYLSPIDKQITNMFEPIINSLILLYNFEGFYWPSQGVNTLDNWDEYSGYVIKLIENDVLSIYGAELTDTKVNLEASWNIVPVLSTADVDVVSIFAGIAGFYAAKDVAGQGVYWPAYNFNTLGNLKTGKSYFVYMTSPGSITFPAGGFKTSAIEPVTFENVSPWNDVYYTPATHIVAFASDAISGFEKGDIIAAFTQSGLCAGMNMFSGDGTGLVLNGDDDYTVAVDGFASNENISYKLYRSSTDETFDLEVSYDPALDNTGKFQVNSMSAITKVKLLATGIEQPSGSNIRIYPNPTQCVFTVEGIDDNTNIRIFNAFGEEVFVNRLSSPGNIDLTGQMKGVYFVRIESAKGTIVQKLVLN